MADPDTPGPSAPGPSATPRDARLRHVALAQRNVALTIVGTFGVWVLLLGLGNLYGWPQRLMGLFDLAALAGLGWALYNLWRIRGMRRED
jgi:hypothetical protein